MKILFLCRGNVGRSVFAENLYNKLFTSVEARSAGTRLNNTLTHEELPGAARVVTVMAEEGIDVSKYQRKQVTQEMIDWSDAVISMAEPETVPDFVKNHRNLIEWEILDPKGTDINTHRKIKDQIKEKIIETFGQ